MSKRTTDIEDLFVADFRDESHTPETQKWKTRKLSTKVFRAEACARQIWVGSKEQFSDFPELQSDPRNQMLEGKDGYRQLLRYMLGIVNEDQYDPAAEKRFFDGWSAINRTCPQFAAPYNMIVAKLVADKELISKNVFSALLPDRAWMIARDLAGQKPGDTTLIIGDMDKAGQRLSTLTQKMATTLNDRGCNASGTIALTHPDADVSHDLHQATCDVYEKNDILLSPREANFYDDLPKLVEEVDQLYVTMDCNEQPEAYAYLMSCWLGRARDDNQLVDLKNSVKDAKTQASLSNKSMKDNSLIWSDALADEKNMREIHNRKIMNRVFLSIESCVNARSRGEDPTSKDLEDYIPS